MRLDGMPTVRAFPRHGSAGYDRQKRSLTMRALTRLYSPMTLRIRPLDL